MCERGENKLNGCDGGGSFGGGQRDREVYDLPGVGAARSIHVFSSTTSDLKETLGRNDY